MSTDISAENVPIGSRLRDERTRLGLNQSDFAKVAFASKRTQIQWESGSTTPNAEALSALSAIGVDVLYVVTGRREGARSSGLSATDANAHLARIESSLEARQVPLSGKDRRADECAALQAIATDDRLPEETRGRADMMLRVAFEDEEAEARAEARAARLSREIRIAETVISDATRSAGFEPPQTLRMHLVHLVSHYKVRGEIITDILSDLRRITTEGNIR